MSGTAPSAVRPPSASDALWASEAELRTLTELMPGARATRYGNVNVRTRVSRRSTSATAVVTDGRGDGSWRAGRTISRQAGASFARLQDEYIAGRPMVAVGGHLGHTGRHRAPAMLVVEQANAAGIDGAQRLANLVQHRSWAGRRGRLLRLNRQMDQDENHAR